MVKCPSCKTKLTESAKFCFACGFKLPESITEIDPDLAFLKRTLEPKFIEIQKIGQGGMGSIFLGKQVSLNRKVVIKLLNASLALDKKISENFLKEAQIAANLKHPNIVEMVDYGKAEGRSFFIMEFGENGSYEKILEDLKQWQKKIPSIKVCHIMVKILNALHFAHSENLLAHRDIKPHNIIVRDSGEIFITDFGVALDKNEKNKQSNDIAGTLEYMSPEQIKGSKDIDHRSDIYSLGIVFFEMLSCSLPFESLDKDKLADMHLHSEIPELKKRFTKEELKSISKEEIPLDLLQHIIRKACEKDKDKRYSSCKEMSDAIQAIINSIEEKKTESYKKNRKLIAIYSLIAGSLIIFISFITARYFVVKTCKNCCISGDCVNGKGKYVYDSGNVYTGDFKDAKKHGNGEYLIYSNKSKFEGNFSNGEYSGYGTLISYRDSELKQENARYSGEFKSNKPHGQGVYNFADGSYFTGAFENGVPDGKQGIFYTKEKSLYKGDLKHINGEMIPDGKGILLFADDKVYIGEFRNSKLHGKGRLIQPDGTVVSGKWENGRILLKKK